MAGTRQLEPKAWIQTNFGPHQALELMYWVPIVLEKQCKLILSLYIQDNYCDSALQKPNQYFSPHCAINQFMKRQLRGLHFEPLKTRDITTPPLVIYHSITHLTFQCFRPATWWVNLSALHLSSPWKSHFHTLTHRYLTSSLGVYITKLAVLIYPVRLCLPNFWSPSNSFLACLLTWLPWKELVQLK